jgi:hypothetical protein
MAATTHVQRPARSDALLPRTPPGTLPTAHYGTREGAKTKGKNEASKTCSRACPVRSREDCLTVRRGCVRHTRFRVR